jgi:DNA polymerase-3 subunit epsilon
MRKIILDTETTGINPKLGHRIIEVGCVEIINREITGNNYHQYLNPMRTIEYEAIKVHGLTNDFLNDKPVFADIAKDLYNYLSGAELIIHNAVFDMGFLNNEFSLLDNSSEYKLSEVCSVTDTLKLARAKHPAQHNSLDALCKRYGIDNSSRQLHGALLDAQLLCEVYLLMTGGQSSLFKKETTNFVNQADALKKASKVNNIPSLKVIQPTAQELIEHNKKLKEIEQQSGLCFWQES